MPLSPRPPAPPVSPRCCCCVFALLIAHTWARASDLMVTTHFPAVGAVAVNPDTPLRLTFDREVRVGSAGRVRLVREVEPGLAQFGVAGSLRRPLLAVLAGDRVVAQNSNWSTSAEAAAIATAATEAGAFPLTAGNTEADAALMLNLSPGNYTAQVTGADGGTGVALLEVYEVP